MGKQETLGKFNILLDKVATDGDKEDIEVSCTIFKQAMSLLANFNPRQADELVNCFEGALQYYNYLTKSETGTIVDAFVNQDGSRGAKWNSSEEFFELVGKIGGDIECGPYYNKWALYVTANKFASDQHSVIHKWVGTDKEKYLEACYDLAVAQLEDKDKPNWVRWYFNSDND